MMRQNVMTRTHERLDHVRVVTLRLPVVSDRLGNFDLAQDLRYLVHRISFPPNAGGWAAPCPAYYDNACPGRDCFELLL